MALYAILISPINIVPATVTMNVTFSKLLGTGLVFTVCIINKASGFTFIE